MSRLLLYFIIYLILLSIVLVYIDSFRVTGITITKSQFMVASLIIPFLILIQWTFETLYEIPATSSVSIVGKVLGILLSISIGFVILFYMLKYTVAYLFTSTFISILVFSIIFVLLISIPRVRELLLKTYLTTTSYISMLRDSVRNTKFSKGQLITYSTLFAIFVLSVIFAQLKTIMLPRHKILLAEPKYLNNELIIGTTENIIVKHIGENERNDKQLYINYNYALSCVIYLNPQGQNTRTAYNRFTKILDFGENPIIYFNNKTKQLKLEFYIDEDTKKDVFIELDDDDNKIFYQKWNALVLNMKGGELDLFLNGKVICRHQIANKYKIEKITSGENNGLEGGIKNIVFYNKPLKLYQIHLLNYIASDMI